jgi:N-acetylglucosamine kinase-like BadF-type ATPase
MAESPDATGEAVPEPGRSAGLVVGVDGGGTKTDVVVATLDGVVVGTARGGCANWEVIGVEAVADELRHVVGAALDAAGATATDVVAATFSLAGFDWPSDEARLAPAVDGVGLGGACMLTNDSFAALRAGTPDAFGIVSVAGTGGVCAGRNRQGLAARTMAIALGEGAGAGSLVRSALDAVAAAHHCSGPPTLLTARLLATTGAPDPAVAFEALSRGEVRIDAGFATEVTAAADAGDEVAAAVCVEVGAQHGRDVVGLARRLDMLDDSFDLVLAGGVHTSAQTHLRAAFVEVVHAGVPGAQPIPLSAPPVAGAVLLALESTGVDGPARYETVTANVAQALQTEVHETRHDGQAADAEPRT